MFSSLRTRVHLLVCSSLALIPPALSADSPESVSYNLMLAGGSLHICSSMSQSRCNDTAWVTEEMRQVQLIDISHTRIKDAKEVVAKFAKRPEIVAFFEEIPRIRRQNRPHPVLTRQQFGRYLSEFETQLEHPLTDHDWHLLHDTLEYAQQTHESVRHEHATSPYGGEIIARFTKMAAHARGVRQDNVDHGQAPVILVVTASARDSYEALSFYLNAFAETGANVQWLPIDAPLHHAIETDSCDQLAEHQANISHAFDRARVYPEAWQVQQQICRSPEQVMALLDAADGIFINGGDQSLTRQAFVRADNQPSSWLTAIQSRLAKGTLALGGTSAGSAVQPQAAMISNGTSLAALNHPATALPLPPARDCDNHGSCPQGVNSQSLTYHPDGGIGVFPFGLVDTHFSERQRQARLIALGADTQTKQAVGVDETTALLVNANSGAFEVVGQHGVFFADAMQRTEYQEQSAVTANISYLRASSRGTMTSDGLEDIVFANVKNPRAASAQWAVNGEQTLVELLDQYCEQATSSGHFATQVIALTASATTQWLAHEYGCQVSGVQVTFAINPNTEG